MGHELFFIRQHGGDVLHFVSTGLSTEFVDFVEFM